MTASDDFSGRNDTLPMVSKMDTVRLMSATRSQTTRHYHAFAIVL
jgi:hypothetical protein